jgi:PTS system nitrogen regulatory IIA component
MEATMNLMTIKEVAEAVKVSVSTVRRWVRDGLVPAYKVGSKGQLRFRLEEIEQFVAKQRVRGKEPPGDFGGLGRQEEKR